MARPAPPRLNIPPHLNAQHHQPPMFSPALPTAIQQGFPHMHGHGHAMSMSMPMQTPLQTAFFAGPPAAPGRPKHLSHQARASMQLAAAGIMPPPGVPMTPLGAGPMTPMGPGFPMLGPQGYMGRNRRAPSISTGGPPKAVLGGPGKKHEPLPVPVAVAQANAPPATKPKKVIVNLPKETLEAKDGEPSTSASFARFPAPTSMLPPQLVLDGPELTTSFPYDTDQKRYSLPDTVDVFLPGKRAWTALKHKDIDEKLGKMGIERGSNNSSTAPQIHAPHARAASISSPADPALLLFKLNKLHQSQNASAANSASTSPQPPLSPIPPRLQNKHGYSQSLAHPAVYSNTAAFNPFGPSATLGSDQIHSKSASVSPAPQANVFMPLDIHAPQGRVPFAVGSLAPPMVLSRPDSRESRPDFARGFGLDIPEEEEPEEEPPRRPIWDSDADAAAATEQQQQELEDAAAGDITQEAAGELEAELEDPRTASQSRVHSRHVSKLSAALSLRSVGGTTDGAFFGSVMEAIRSPLEDKDEEGEVDHEEDVIAEWTGSEDLRMDDNASDDEESIGEFSNPSDEERARQQRLHRRMMRRAQQETPRRLPNFPRPPDYEADDDLISNPSVEERMHEQSGTYLNVTSENTFYPRSLSMSGRPLPPVPHSRSTSAQYSNHDPALAHSRRTSEHGVFNGSPYQSPALSSAAPPFVPSFAAALNPSAKPFVFGASRLSGSFNPPAPTQHSPAGSVGAHGSASHSRTPSSMRLNAAAADFKPLNVAAAEFKPLNIAAAEFKPLNAATVQFQPMNVAAPEFKPGSFTFRAPADAPKMPEEMPEPAPMPSAYGPPRAEQGREKRQRRLSVDSLDNDENVGNISMQSFRFPPSDSPQAIRRPGSAPESPTQPTHQRRASSLNANAPPFTFSGVSAARVLAAEAEKQSIVPPISTMLSEPDQSIDAGEGEDVETNPASESDDSSDDEAAAEQADIAERVDELPIPPQFKPKRAPIPLDFKHPVSTNTVPAGLFRALVNGADDRSPRSRGSRMASRDFREHVPRLSLDDDSIVGISKKPSRAQLMPRGDERLQENIRVRSPLTSSPRPMPLSASPSDASEPTSASSGVSLTSVKMGKRAAELQADDISLAQLLDDKMDIMRQELAAHFKASSSVGDSSTQAMIAELTSLFRAQMHESASRSIEESQMDARGELDFQLLKDIVDQGHAESRALIQHDLAEVLRRIDSQRDSGNTYRALVPVMQDLSSKTIETIMRATTQLGSHLGSHLENVGSSSFTANDRQEMIAEIVGELEPHLAAMRADPIDYEGLTEQLTQAVKPHITQIIDLASDKRETAQLIVNSLKPLLPAQTATPPVDVDALSQRLSLELRQIVAPIDAHEIKEQVSDLVVERLDSRLAVRDRGVSSEVIAASVSASLADLLKPFDKLASAVSEVSEGQGKLISNSKSLASVSENMASQLADIPTKLTAAIEALSAVKRSDSAPIETPAYVRGINQDLQKVQAALQVLESGNTSLASSSSTLLSLHQELVQGVNTLPDTLIQAVKILENAHTNMQSRDSIYKRDLDEVRRLVGTNADLQVQLSKARGAHGQVRVEKDRLEERIAALEAERNQLRARAEQADASVQEKAAELAAAETRTREMDAALTRALDSLKTSDMTAQTHQERISALEKQTRELGADKQQLKSKADSLDLQVKFANRDKESAENELVRMRKEHERMLASQENWDNLRRASEQIEMLSTLVRQADDEEVKELRHVRDRSKALEGEHAALQKRYKDQEGRIASVERQAFTARQNLSQAQQRASEWEKRAKELEGESEKIRSDFARAEEARTQLESDMSLARLQVEEKDAHDRLARDRESKLRDQVASLEEKLARMQVIVDEAQKKAPVHKLINGNSNGSSLPTPRPDSRASTISRSVTPTGNGRPSPQPSFLSMVNSVAQSSVKDSMHAPKGRYPSGLGVVTPQMRRPMPNRYPQRIPSPTPSVVSNAPTLGDDGWWS